MLKKAKGEIITRMTKTIIRTARNPATHHPIQPVLFMPIVSAVVIDILYVMDMPG